MIAKSLSQVMVNRYKLKLTLPMQFYLPRIQWKKPYTRTPSLTSESMEHRYPSRVRQPPAHYSPTGFGTSHIMVI